MERRFISVGAILGLLAVASGAFGAHALKDRLSPAASTTFETAARYQMFHALALLAVGLLASRSRALVIAGYAFIIGVVLFSGSLYALALGGPRFFGAITPFGGVSFMIGWAALALAASRASAPPA